VFDWAVGSSRYYELEVIPSERDFSDDAFLSFRACQGTRHPRTDALNNPLNFTATLEDGTGVTSSIDFGNYGHVTRTYLRSSGWANEFNTVRIRLTDFLANSSGLDLTDVVSVRFDFGSAYGSSQGRIGLDDVELAHDRAPMFVPITIAIAGNPPEFVEPDVPAVISVEILEGSDTIVPGSAQLYYRYDGGTFMSTPLTVDGALYEGVMPAPVCGDVPEFYVSVEGSISGIVSDPPAAPADYYTAYVGTYVVIMADDFETDQGWTVQDDPSVSSGTWERDVPIADPGAGYDAPLADYDGSGNCYLTENGYMRDLDGGPTMLISPLLDLSGAADPVLGYARWFMNDDHDADRLDVEISNDGGGSWVLIESVPHTEGWVERTARILDYLDAPLSSEVVVRFNATDNPNNSKTEGAIDAVEIFDISCD